MHSLFATSSLPLQQAQPTTGRHSSSQGQLVAGRAQPDGYHFGVRLVRFAANLNA